MSKAQVEWHGRFQERINELMQQVAETEALVRELVGDYPKGDWSAAPDWAEWRAVNSDGVAYWFDLEPQIYRLDNRWTGYAVWMADGARAAVDRNSQPLALGKDWRLTKEARPKKEQTP